MNNQQQRHAPSLHKNAFAAVEYLLKANGSHNCF